MMNTVVQVQGQNMSTDPITITRGLKEGDRLAPTLFNIALHYVIRILTTNSSNILLTREPRLWYMWDNVILKAWILTAAQEISLN